MIEAAAVSECPAAAFEREIAPYRQQLYTGALRLTHRKEDAEDLVPDTLLKAWGAFHRFAWGTNLRAWLYRIMMNTFLNSYRKRQREPLLLAGTIEVYADASRQVRGESRPAEDQLLDRLFTAELATALRRLPAEFRVAVFLTDVEGYSYQETAQIMDSPLGTVMSRVHRGRRGLRASLSGEPA